MAASHRANGDNLIQKGSLSGNRLRPDTITATQVNVRKLGVVPNATSAQSAHSADALSHITYRSASFAVAANLARATGTATCGPGTFVVGGGVASPAEASASTDFLIDSYPVANHTGWQVTVENDSSSALNETVWAVCVAASATS